jgi:hypothetical protein
VSGWELFTWFNAGVLAIGSLIVVLLFLRQLPSLLGRDEDDAPPPPAPPDRKRAR